MTYDTHDLLPFLGIPMAVTMLVQVVLLLIRGSTHLSSNIILIGGSEKLKAVFESKGLDPKKPIVSTCGTGVMAAACDLALELAKMGVEDERRVYDGSWTEYAMRVGKDDGLIVKEY